MTSVPVVRLDSIAEVRLGRQRSPKNHNGPRMRPYVRAANVGWEGLLLDDVKRMNFTDEEMIVYGLQEGDILLNEASGSAREVGKPAIWMGDIEECAFQNTLVRVRPHRAESRYLLHYFRLEAASGKFAAKSRGVGIHHLGREALAAWSIPLPPLDEQQRITAVLDQADELRAKRRTALGLVDAIAESLFVTMFETNRPVTIGRAFPVHDQGWKWELLTDVAQLATGHTPDRERDDYWEGEIPWISLTEIRRLDGQVAQTTKLTVSPEGIRKSSAVLLPAGTVCFSRTASIGFVTVMGAKMATSQDFVNWICGDRLDPIYLMHALLLSRRRLRMLSSGSTHKTIYMRVAEQFRVLVPPLELQLAFAARIRSSVDVKASQGAFAVQLDALYSSLEHRAFSGEL